jgi:stage III sporulation protein AC
LFCLFKGKDPFKVRFAYLRKVQKVDIDFIFKIAAIGIIVAVLGQLLIRSGREDQAMLTTLAGLVVVLFMVIEVIAQLFETIKEVFGL